MDSRTTRPIRLKGSGNAQAAAVSGMLAALEGRTAAGCPRPAIWTEEFLASGKPARAIKKPIRLRSAATTAAPEVAEMVADLEGKSSRRTTSPRRAIWTREFVASGKFGKAM